MTRFLPALLLAMVALMGADQGPAARVPVLVELFTSEGCSSCPPADQVLSALVRDQPVAGVEVIALGLHVDYWDDLGWRDVASSAAATARQRDYGRVFGSDRIYTPQIVVDGTEETVGSDETAVRRAIAANAQHPRAAVSVSAERRDQVIVIDAAVTGVPTAVTEPLEVLAAVLEDGVTTVVRRGENGGRTLHHDAVVRVLTPLGRVDNGRYARRHSIQAQPGWSSSPLSAAVFVQGVKSQRIWGAARARLR